MNPGQYYLHCAPWDWTIVGQFVRVVDRDHLAYRNAGYFTHTGATFDKLCRDGLVEGKSKFHPCDGDPTTGEIIVPIMGLKFPWNAPTPWAKRKGPINA